MMAQHTSSIALREAAPGNCVDRGKWSIQSSPRRHRGTDNPTSLICVVHDGSSGPPRSQERVQPLLALFSVPPCPRGELLRSALVMLLLLASSASTSRAEPDVKPADPASATNQPAPGHSIHGEIFDEGPRQAAVLMGHTGDVHFPVSSKVPEVEQFINQGVGQLHGFWYFESERSFRQAAKLDPDCATAYLGSTRATIRT